MKKITVALITLVLVCSSVFAGISVTAGAGFGHNIAQIKGSKKLWMESAVRFVAGVDYEMTSGLSVYSDSSFGYVIDRNATEAREKAFKEAKLNVIELVEQAGVGYTFHFNQFSLMTGAGVDMRFVSSTAEKARYNDKLLAFGASARVKGVYAFSETWAVSAQINPAIDLLYVKSDIQNKTNLISCNGYIGGVYKF